MSDEQRLHLSGPAGVIEAVLTTPSELTSPALVGVVCHPHPLGGGSMDNKVVATLVRLLRDRGIPVLRFNFRGVGGSAGQFAEGVGEQEDLRAVLDYARSDLGARRVLLAGFSFGSYIAAAVASSPVAGLSVQQLLLIAPPVHNYPFASLALPGERTVIVQGDADEIVPAALVLEWAAQVQPAPVVIRMADCSHFFHGRLSELKALLDARLRV